MKILVIGDFHGGVPKNLEAATISLPILKVNFLK
jgi:hypothetical protein